MRLSISGLPRAAACPGSAVLPVAATQSAFAESGTDRHATAELAIKSGAHEKLPEEIRALLVPGAIAMAEVPVAYNVATDTARLLDTESRQYDVGADEIPGTIDLLIISPDGRIVVVDHKGYASVGKPDRNEQVMGYALCAARIYDVHELDLVVAYLADDDDGSLSLIRPLVRATVDSGDLDGWYVPRLRRIWQTVREQTQRYHTLGILPDTREGDWCRWCNVLASGTCPAKSGLVAQLATAMTLGPLTLENAGAVYEHVRALRPVLGAVEAQIKAMAAHTPIPLPNGNELRQVTAEGNEYLVDADIVHAVLKERHGTDVADNAIKVVKSTSKAAVEAAIKGAGVTPVAPAMKRALTVIRDRGGAKREMKTSIQEVPGSRALTKAGGE